MSRPLLSLVLAVLLLSVGCLSAHAATFYVSTAGADSVTCAQAQSAQTPRRTINRGIACLSSGDTLVVKPGVYDELVTDATGVGGYTVRPPDGGSWATPTTIRAETKGTATIQVSNPPGDYQSPVYFDNVNYVVLEGFVLNAGAGPQVPYGIHTGTTSPNRMRFKDLHIIYPADQGMKGSITNKEFINVDISHVGFHPVTGADVCTSCGTFPCSNQVCHGYYTSSGDTNGLIDGGTLEHIRDHAMQFYSSNSTIRNLTIKNMGGGGIWLLGGGNTVYNNVIHDSEGLGVLASSSNNTIMHNTVYNMRTRGGIGAINGTTVIKNNLVLQVASDYISVDTGINPSQVAGNLCDAPGMGGCVIIQASPSPVVNAGARDFHLRGGSPAIAAGGPLLDGAMKSDKDGVARPPTGAVDVGAYQYVSGGPRLPAPKNLRATVR
jgi:parallel beta-helix repeat protein